MTSFHDDSSFLPHETMELSSSTSALHDREPIDAHTSAIIINTDVKETLLHCLLKNRHLHIFLRVTGIIWNDPDIPSLYINIQQCVWSASIRAGLGIMFFWGIGGSVMVHNYQSLSLDTKICLVIYGITLFLQSLTLCMSLAAIDKRIKAPAGPNDVLFANASLKPSYRVLVSTLVLGVVPEVMYIAATGLDKFYALLVGELAICFVMAATTFFITADCQVACSLIDEVTEQQRQETLTFEHFTTVRDDILRREKSSYWVNNALVLVTLFDVMAVVLFLFLDVLDYGAFYDFAFVISLFLKEIPFLFVVFWHVSQVNEKAAVFMKETAVRRWSANCSSDSGRDNNDKGSNAMIDTRNNERRDICISSQACPIAYSLAGMRLKRRDLLWQLLVWCIAFVVGILKKLVEANVD